MTEIMQQNCHFIKLKTLFILMMVCHHKEDICHGVWLKQEIERKIKDAKYNGYSTIKPINNWGIPSNPLTY